MEPVMLAHATLNMIAEFYPEFLARHGLTGSPLVKAGYYAAVEHEAKRNRLSDPLAQDILVKKIRILIKTYVKQANTSILDDMHM
jgi:hypothetical protein